MAKSKNSGGTIAMRDDVAYFERKNMIGPAMNFAAAEAYKLLRTNLMFSFAGGEHHIVGMTSSFRGEGKTLTSINLSYTLAEAEQTVLLIECDMRLPTISTRLNLSATPGLSNLLVGLNSVGSAVQTYSAKVGDHTVSMDVIVAGDIPPNPSEILGSERMRTLLDRLQDRYNFIILDLPPVTAVSDAIIASHIVDGMLVVVRGNHAVRGALADTMRQLNMAGAKILGFVFNGAEESEGRYYKKGYYKKGGYYSNYYYKK